MPKTIEYVGLVAAGTLLALTGAGVIAVPWLAASALPLLEGIGVRAGISGVFGLLQPILNPINLAVPGSQQNFQESAAYRRTVYGYVETGGILTFDNFPSGGAEFQCQDEQHEWRHQVYTLAAHQITSFGKGSQMAVVIDGVVCPLYQDVSGYWVPQQNLDAYYGHIGFEFDLGNPSNTAQPFPLLSSACPQWNGSCLQRGRAKVHVAMRWDQYADGSQVGNGTDLSTPTPIYVNGRVPDFRFQMTGKPVTDPRTGLIATNSSNPALIINDYLQDVDYGMQASAATIDTDSIIAAANICEEEVVVYIGTNGKAVTEQLYTCNGIFDHSQARGDTLKGLLSSMAGTIVPPGDLWRLYAGVYQYPTVTLQDGDLRGSIKFDFRISRRDICNGVKGTFLPAALPANQTQAQPGNWRATDFPPYQGNGMNGHPNYIAEDGGQIIWKDIHLPFTTSIWMAQRLAKIVLQTLRFQVTGSLTCKLSAFQVQVGQSLIFEHARWLALAEPPPSDYVVTQRTLSFENQDGVPAAGVDLQLRETDPSIYEFAPPTSSSDQGEYSPYGSLATI